jgi:hypothetical protein
MDMRGNRFIRRGLRGVNPEGKTRAYFRSWAALFLAWVVWSGSTALEPLQAADGPSSRRTGWAITEIMYRPAIRADGMNAEFIELQNTQPFAEDLGGYSLAGEVRYRFPLPTVVPPRGHIVVAANPALTREAYGLTNVFGPWTNRLANDQGLVRLLNPAGAVVLELTYSSRPPWPVAADGTGHSLVLTRPTYGEADPRAWGASLQVGGSPGRSEPAANNSPSPFISEVLVLSEGGQPAFVEVVLPGPAPVDLSAATLVINTPANEYRLPPGTVLNPGSVHAIQVPADFWKRHDTASALFLRAPGDGRVIDAVAVEPQLPGQSWGRTVRDDPELRPLTRPTPGSIEAPLARGPVVISEIMFHPPTDLEADEYLELRNTTDAVVDLEGWRLTGGIEFEFPGGALLGPRGYGVVAGNRDRLLAERPRLEGALVWGDFRGRLSDRGERIRLLRPRPGPLPGSDPGRVQVDVVDYGEGGLWGRWADGGGSSLELRDPRPDPRFALSWANSDESRKSEWILIEHTGVLDHGSGSIDSLQVFLQGEGECLLDRVAVLDGGGVNRIANGDFTQGISGWVAEGTQSQSRWEPAEGQDSQGSLRLVAVARGDTGANRIRVRLTSALTAGSTVTIRAYARWLRGCPDLLLRLRGNYLEAVGRLPVPSDTGSPGRANGAADLPGGPVFGPPMHSPLLPAAGEAVRVTVAVTHPEPLGEVFLRYRLDPSTNLVSVPLRDDGQGGDGVAGDGLYSALIAGQGTGALVAFHVVAQLAHDPSLRAVYPPNAPTGECLVRFGEQRPSGPLGTYRLWMTAATFSRWTSRSKLDNTPLEVTFVYNDERAIHQVGALYAGSPHISPGYTTPSGRLCGYVLLFPEDDRWLGETDVVLDWPDRDRSKVQEQAVYWMARQMGLPFIHRRFVRLHVNGVTEAQRGGIYEDTQQVNSEYLESWQAGPARGDLHKIEQWFEFDDAGGRYVTTGPTLQNFTTTGGARKLARYRWTWLKRAAPRANNNFTNLLNLVEVLNQSEPTAYLEAVRATIDVEQWMRIFALENVIANFDSYGHQIGKNMYAFKPAGERWQMHMWDIDWLMNASAALGYSPTSPLFTPCEDPTVARMYTQPEFRRAYLRAVRDAVDGPLRSDQVEPYMDALHGALTAAGVNPASTAEGKTWLRQRRAYLLQELAKVEAPFALIWPEAAPVRSAGNLVTLRGTAPVTVASVRILGRPYPLRWTSVTNWSLELPLAAGTNVLELLAYDGRNTAMPLPALRATLIIEGALDSPLDRVVINELLYRANVPGAEFVELHNTSSITAFALGGLRLRGLDYVFPAETFVRPGGFAVVTADRAAFLSAFGSAATPAGEYGGRLDPAGELIALEKPADDLGSVDWLDAVRFEPLPPWPVAAAAGGISLQLVDPRQDNRVPANWSAQLPAAAVDPLRLVDYTNVWRRFTGAGEPTGDWRQPGYAEATWVPGPGLFYVESSPLPAPALTPLTLGATTYYFRTAFELSELTPRSVLSLQTIVDDGVVLYLNGAELFRLGMPDGRPSYGTFASRNVPDAVVEGAFELDPALLHPGRNVLSAEVHQVNATSSDVVFGLRLELQTRLLAAATPGATNSVSAALPALPTLWLNELYLLPPSGTAAPFTGLPGAPAWVELFNAGTRPIELEACALSDEASDLLRWRFPPQTACAPGQFLRVWFGRPAGSEATTDLCADFQPAAGTGTIFLSTQVQGRPAVLDYVRYDEDAAGQSIGLVADGDPLSRSRLTSPSPGQPNAPAALLPRIRINEWMADNRGSVVDPADGDFDDWFELFNAGTAAVDLSGCFLTDDPANPRKARVPLGFTIPPQGFLVVWADETSSQTRPPDRLHVSFQLNRSGEFLGLYDPAGRLIDAVSFGPQLPDVSEGLYPDGDPSPAMVLDRPTPGGPNALGSGLEAPEITRIELTRAGELLVEWRSQPGARYRVESADRLANETWTPSGEMLTADGSSLGFRHPLSAESGTGFFRIVRLP